MLNKLTFSNFFTHYLIDSRSQTLSVCDQRIATLASVLLGVFTAGIVHLIVWGCSLRDRNVKAKELPKALEQRVKQVYLSMAPKPIVEAPQVKRAHDQILTTRCYKEWYKFPNDANNIRALIHSWNTQRDRVQKNCSIQELAHLFQLPEDVLEKFFNQLGFIEKSQIGRSKDALNLFIAKLNNALKQSRDIPAVEIPSVRSIWNGEMPHSLLFYGSGESYKMWTLQKLSKFLAVKQDALKEFLDENDVDITERGYLLEDLRCLFRDRSLEQKSTYNLIRDNRTQVGSVRWFLIANT